LLGWPTLREGGSSALGVVLVLIACSSYGVAVSASVPLAQKYGSIPVFWRCQLLSVVLTAPFGMWSLRTAHWDTRAALALLSLGALGTAIAFIAMIDLSARVGSTRGASLTYLEAIIALALGIAVRGEPVIALEIVGSGVLLLGAWLVSRADR
jgi:drug/metabolite transporter (DMT)-like permease